MLGSPVYHLVPSSAHVPHDLFEILDLAQHPALPVLVLLILEEVQYLVELLDGQIVLA